MELDAHIYDLTHMTVSQSERIDSTMFPHGAPYKALVVLCVLDLIRKGAITSNRIGYTPVLEQRYRTYLELLSCDSRTPLAMPFSALHSEPFWKLTLEDGILYDDVRPALKSPPRLRKVLICASLSVDFWDVAQYEAVRGVFRFALLNAYFSKIAHARMWEYSFF